MSSTKRGSIRHVSDYYVTPQKPILNFLESFEVSLEYNNFPKITKETTWLDPCAGGDKKNKMAYVEAIKTKYGSTTNVDSIDIRQDSRAITKGDFLLITPTKKYDVVITNPPFVLSEQIIKKSFDFCKDDGYVIMLLRLNHFGSKKRISFWQNMPLFTYVHSQRISFTGGRCDSIEYMHCVWRKGHNYTSTQLKVI